MTQSTYATDHVNPMKIGNWVPVHVRFLAANEEAKSASSHPAPVKENEAPLQR